MAIIEEKSVAHALGHSGRSKTRLPLWRRLAWLVGIWSASVLALGGMAWLMRLVMSAAGLGISH